MNEEEIIKVITYKLNMKNADVYAPILYEEIQSLLDLYNKEKEKNLFLEGFKVGAEEAIKELKEKNKEYERILDIWDNRKYRKRYLEERRKEQPNLLYPDADEIYQKYYEEKEKNKELEEHQKQYLDGELITSNQGKFFEKIIKENYIRKDKIKEIIEDLNEKIKNATETEAILMIKQQQILQKVLEE